MKRVASNIKTSTRAAAKANSGTNSSTKASTRAAARASTKANSRTNSSTKANSRTNSSAKAARKPLVVQVFPLTAELSNRVEIAVRASYGQLKKSTVIRETLEKATQKGSRKIRAALREESGAEARIPISTRVRPELIEALEREARRFKVSRSLIARTLLAEFLPKS